ncbi:spheroidene monooxygenase [Jannaschia sp. GRR-S6-38]|uniref:Spheroidene monooxygenase n=1 Tax=Jannaschia ovalis TaxID=3038773 RepID=A0ABY8LGE8_9RHOB|nr:spheroidene monooxygenase [Jannaschia sp. GRR-S6-38]WGH80346.1 spheroidene monooxygenase [Jannaschia sp. GRR-S6-38]
MQTVTLSLYRFDPLRDRLWAFAQMGLSRWPLARLPGLRFWKLMGSGTGEGFTPIPNTAVWAILCCWSDPAAARAGLSAPVLGRWSDRATEFCTLTLDTVSARGRWSGAQPFAGAAAPTGPLAALTRATIRPRNLLRFWRRVPDISARVGEDPAVRLKIGVGEVPLLHQVTFSVWPDAQAMARFARNSGPHAEAIRAVRDGDWFAEELYARFRITDAEGRWQGRPIHEVLA